MGPPSLGFFEMPWRNRTILGGKTRCGLVLNCGNQDVLRTVDKQFSRFILSAFPSFSIYWGWRSCVFSSHIFQGFKSPLGYISGYPGKGFRYLIAGLFNFSENKSIVISITKTKMLPNIPSENSRQKLVITFFKFISRNHHKKCVTLATKNNTCSSNIFPNIKREKNDVLKVMSSEF